VRILRHRLDALVRLRTIPDKIAQTPESVKTPHVLEHRAQGYEVSVNIGYNANPQSARSSFRRS
jgi:hypothetical protein